MTQQHLHLHRDLDAPPQRVWRALTDPQVLAEWFWPPAFATRCTVDLRPGGAYRIESAAMGMAVGGEYVEVDAPRRLVLRWQWDGEQADSRVTVTLAGSGGGTRLDLTHEGLADEQARADHVQGWTDCLDRLPVAAP